MNKKVRQVVTAHGGSIAGEEYFPLDHADYGKTIDQIASTGAEVVFNTIVPPGSRRSSRAALPLRFHAARRIHGLHVLRRELP
ncbi:ABC transporter substrate-binding protein [Cupriavidus basilensis]